MASARSEKTLISFNGGEVSPLLDSRVDLAQMANACRTMKNILPSTYGLAKRRAGTIFIAQTREATAWDWSSEGSWNSGEIPGGFIPPPVLSPSTGTFTVTRDVSVTTQSGTTVRYTADGSGVTVTSDVWPTDSDGVLQAITLSATTTIRAKAYFLGAESAEDVETYTKTGVLPAVATPVFHLSSTDFTITCATSGATIYWREEGGSLHTYSVAVMPTAGTTYEAYATKTGYADSAFGILVVWAEWPLPEP